MIKRVWLNSFMVIIITLSVVFGATSNVEAFNFSDVAANVWYYNNLEELVSRKVINEFYDEESGGFYLTGKDSEKLICRPKETFDGAIPCGNSLMAWNLIRLAALVQNDDLAKIREALLDFLAGESAEYPAGHGMFLLALTEHLNPNHEKVQYVCDEYCCRPVKQDRDSL